MATNADNIVTGADQKFFSTLFKYLPSRIDMDWDQFSKDMGFKDAHIAKARFSQIRRKFSAGRAAVNSPNSPLKGKPHKVTKAKASGKGRVKKQGVGLDRGDDDDEKKSVVKGKFQDDEKEQAGNGNYRDEKNDLIKKEAVSDDEDK
ncbi:hypothetical protein F4781DRAFT_427372 [Annulohypoxylon bovei var. microspora]|nr:hypothetical protein F4781DRAFT_427372 [Annulohypoxylon bovei var. microspora]